MISEVAVRELIRHAGDEEMLARLDALERHWQDRLQRPRAMPSDLEAPGPNDRLDYDVAMAGGGLSLLLIPLLARAGLRVAVIERHRAATAQREWNASGPELRPLVESGLLTADELDTLVVARYRHGVCRWHGGGSYPVPGVLDHAVDAAGLLRLVRDRSLAAGATILNGHLVTDTAASNHGVRLRMLRTDGGRATLSARVFVDGRGAASPDAAWDLVCPTVGGVLRGLEEGDGPNQIDPQVGEILVTTDDVREGSQHIWEAFPGRPGETTVYLFCYSQAHRLGPKPLQTLYRRFFDWLPSYKHGRMELVRPTFGFIPAWSRLGRGPVPPGPQTLLVGDAAARHSPLTYCGFGQMLRSFRTAANAAEQLAAGGPAPGSLADNPIHAGTGALSLLLAKPPRSQGRASELNKLLDAAFSTLHAMGPEPYGALLRDEMRPADFVRFLRQTAGRYPRVYGQVARQLGITSTSRWAWRLWRTLRQGPGRD